MNAGAGHRAPHGKVQCSSWNELMNRDVEHEDDAGGWVGDDARLAVRAQVHAR